MDSPLGEARLTEQPHEKLNSRSALPRFFAKLLSVIASLLGSHSKQARYSFDELFVIEHFTEDQIVEMYVAGLELKNYGSLLLCRTRHAFTLLGSLIIFTLDTLWNARTVLAPERLLLSTARVPMIVLLGRSPSCPHIPRPPPRA